MATLNQWVAGARPRTLPAAVAPVAVGTGAAYVMEKANTGYALLALLVSLLLQVGVNYANDYSDGIRGTDATRVGPVRLVGQGLATPSNVKLAAFIAFFWAGFCGLALITLSGVWWMLIAGAASIWAAWKYTGGDKPYGYLGLGEVFVFVFFGLVATLGTTYTQAKTLNLASVLGAIGVGVLAVAILLVNNLRDIPGDTVAGKRTLAVRIGDRATRIMFVSMYAIAALAVAGIAVQHPIAAVGLVGLLPAVLPIRTVMSGAKGRDLIPALAGAGLTSLTYGLALGLGLYLVYATR